MTSEEPAAGSVSKVSCLATVRGRGEARVSLFKHLAPLTVGALLSELPVDSRVNVQPSMVCLFTNIRIGVEKPRTSFGRGDVAFLPSGSLLCFFLRDAKSDRPLNPLGKTEDGITVLEAVRQGDTVRLALAAEGSPATP